MQWGSKWEPKMDGFSCLNALQILEYETIETPREWDSVERARALARAIDHLAQWSDDCGYQTSADLLRDAATEIRAVMLSGSLQLPAH